MSFNQSVEAHLAKMDDFSYASSRSGHDTESLGSVEVHRISKVPYVSMLEQVIITWTEHVMSSLCYAG